jgi:hypothetical protein
MSDRPPGLAQMPSWAEAVLAARGVKLRHVTARKIIAGRGIAA